MKSFFTKAAVLLIILLPLFGCKGGEQNIAVPTVFNSRVQIETENTEISGQLNRITLENATFTIQEPSELSKMQITFTPENDELLFNGMNTKCKIPDMAPIKQVFYLLDDASKGNSLKVKEKSDENIICVGTCEHGEYEITLNKKSHIPICLKASDLICTFEKAQ